MTPDRGYDRLDACKVTATAEALGRRAEERFPGSGLAKVIAQVADVSRETATVSQGLQRPYWLLRAGIAVLIGLIVSLVIGAILSLDWSLSAFSTMADLAQGLEAVVNEFVLLAVAIFFLATCETRLKRRRALQAMHVLRSMAHIIDMHQLTKDPEYARRPVVLTASSPKRQLTAEQLSRYLEYCSEALSIISKLAALYVQNFTDPPTVSAVNEVEDLTNGLSRKIWQKIMILDRVREADNPGRSRIGR